MKTSILALALGALGCVSLHFGAMPDTALLESSLRPHVSTKADVLRVLGPPRGYGMGALPGIRDAGYVWFYEYTGSSGDLITQKTNADIHMLLAFFAGETYEGYLWFSTASEVAQSR